MSDGRRRRGGSASQDGPTTSDDGLVRRRRVRWPVVRRDHRAARRRSTTIRRRADRFGADDTGPLPHWTEPPTGEVPRHRRRRVGRDPTDDVDVWSSFADDVARRGGDDARGRRPANSTWHDDRRAVDDAPRRADVRRPVPAPDRSPNRPSRPRREPARITIGTDPSRRCRGDPDPSGRGASPQRPRRAPAPTARRRRRPRHARWPSPSACVIAAVFLALADVGAAGRRWRSSSLVARPGRRRVLRQGHREGLPAGDVAGIVGLRRGCRSPPTGRARRRSRW